MSLFLTLLAALAACWAHGLFPRFERPGFKVALRGFVVGSLATAAALALASRGALSALRPMLLLTAAAAGLVSWTGLIRLVSFEARRRDVVNRISWLGTAALAFAFGHSVGGAAFSAVCGTLAWRWKRELHTRARFTLGMAALALGLALLPRLGAIAPLPPALEPLEQFARLALITATWYSLFGSIALLRAWVQDPSLGIRTVRRRLALSHVLVGLVPVLLLLALWAATTVLGVLGERAIVGERAVEAQERWQASLLRDALLRPDESRARLEALPAIVDPAADIRVWQRTGPAFERRAGSALPGEARLVRWLDSLGTLPSSGVMRLDDSLFMASAAIAPGGSGAVMLTPLDDALGALPDSVTRARLWILSRGSLGRAALSPAARDARAAHAADSVLEAMNHVGDGDSAAAAGIRRSIRGLGLSDKGLQISTSHGRSSGAMFSAGGDTFDVARHGGEYLLEGHAIVDGIVWRDSTWQSTRFLLVASVPPLEVLSGLMRDVQTNPAGWVPLILVGLFAIVALLVIAWDLAMVRGMGGSITQAVAALRDSASRMSAGDLSHRIAIRGEDDLWQVAAAFNAASAGLERARDAEKERARLENELDVARRIQSRLLPASAPRVRGLEVAGLYNPAREVGGDFYDHIALDDHRVLLVIADVSGKSVPAALIMAGFRAALVSQNLDSSDPPDLAERLNGFLNNSLDPGKFVTAFLAVVDGATGDVVYVNAGHNPPVLLRADGDCELLETGGTILGIMPGSRYERGRTSLAVGDVLVLYTDGVTEGTSPDSELWGDDRLVAAVRARAAEPCDDLVCAIAADVRAFEAERGAADDVTLIAVRRVATD